MQWREWSALNKELLEQWRMLLTCEGARDAFSDSPAPVPHALDDAALYRMLMEISGDVLAVFETSKGCISLSSNWERLTGRTAAQSLRDGFYACLEPQEIKPFIALLQQAICEQDGQKSLLPHSFRLRTRDGWRWFALEAGPVTRLENGAQRIACCLRDVQAQRDQQQKLEQVRRDMELALQSRSEFLNAMSHELRTPLNAILGFTQIMESGMYGPVANSQYRDYLKHIRESGYELLAQIDDVMEMASMQARGDGPRETCDLHGILTRAIGLHRQHARAAAVEIVCRVRPEAIALKADCTQLTHCFSHLIANAVCHNKRGGQVTVEAEFNAQDELCVRVRDNGPGIAAVTLRRLVASLHHAQPEEDAPGLGVGLPLASESAKLHGGYLTLESARGKGTCVTVHLPPECIAAAEGEMILRKTAVAV